MNVIRSMGIVVGAGAVAILAGCVAPGPYYADGAYPYYAEPGPVVVQPNVVLGVDAGPRYWGGRPYYGPNYPPGYRPGYPGYGPRPGYAVPRPVYPGRPGVAVPVRPGRPVAPAGVPRPYAVPSPAPGAPAAVVQPSWNNRERP